MPYPCVICGREIALDALVCPGCGTNDAGNRAYLADERARVEQEKEKKQWEWEVTNCVGFDRKLDKYGPGISMGFAVLGIIVGAVKWGVLGAILCCPLFGASSYFILVVIKLIHAVVE